MTKTEKIHVEQLMEDAWEWWNNLSDPYIAENIILKEYMKAKGIKKNNVQW